MKKRKNLRMSPQWSDRHMSSKKTHEKYEIKDGKLERKRPFCNRCGRGYFMADHGDRYTCGHCGFTIFKPKEQ